MVMRTYDDARRIGMGIADFVHGNLYWNPNLTDSSTTWGNQVSAIKFTAFNIIFFYLIAFNTFVDILKLEEKI